MPACDIQKRKEDERIMLLQYLTLLETESGKEFFADFYKEHREEMYYKAYKILQDKEDAEDVVQEAFLALIRNADRLLNAESGKVWFYMDAVVENKSHNLLRQREMERILELSENGIEKELMEKEFLERELIEKELMEKELMGIELIEKELMEKEFMENTHRERTHGENL